MKELLENAEEFLKSGEENLEKERFNVAVSDFFKAIAILCDYIIYREIKILPKNHADRFSLLRTHFKDVYNKITELFNLYVLSYNKKLTKQNVLELKTYAYELKTYISSK